MTSSPCTRSDGDPRALPGFRRTYAPGRLTLGLGFPLRSRADGDDVHDPAAQVRLARAAEAGGFAALYVRDIPLRVPSFGDVGQVYDPWVYLTHIAAHTSRIALGTAGMVLPVRHPLHVAKSAASVDRLSGGRLLLGLASGDRPEEFRAFGLEQGERGERFRENLRVMTHALTTEMRGIRWSGGWMHSADVVPKPTAASVPVIMIGSCQQSVAYLAAYGDGWMTYPRDFDAQRRTAAQWREAVAAAAEGGHSAGGGAEGGDAQRGARDGGEGNDGEVFKPFAQSLQIDLAEDPDESASPITFGFRIGRRRLVDHLEDLRGIGVNHVQLGLGACRRPVGEVIAELAEHVVPHFPALAP
ncbi:LLM class flavin-dependent oxidoreductase [Dietzia lutea]|uniref:5,10-methylene tetrahydromethanopterin reductase n=1 Tax=Dietzia lutea TaxID=546160 RepID=A0A2S1R7Y9_9ACTN|nr:LLM class flavin-dependent oxidoreductase [Dietzia lutea]AWH92417.1 5,10-methylene tetrahydromethanopterin reductase [Dietzia lutea]